MFLRVKMEGWNTENFSLKKIAKHETKQHRNQEEM